MENIDDLLPGPQRPPEPTGSPFLSFDVKAELHRLRTEDHPWQAGRNAKILVKYSDFRILLIALRPGAHMAEHKTIGSVSVQTVSGHVIVRAGGQVLDLPQGQLLSLEREMLHDVEALTESAIIVTIAWPRV